jgi:hypothetical protein
LCNGRQATGRLIEIFIRCGGDKSQRVPNGEGLVLLGKHTHKTSSWRLDIRRSFGRLDGKEQGIFLNTLPILNVQGNKAGFRFVGIQ